MNPNTSSDVIVIGGGPAGSATALFLSQKGHRVLLLEQAHFPRDKVCGEFISPAADPLFAEMGLLEKIEALSPQRLSGVSISAYGDDELHIDYPSLSGQRMTSLSLPRRSLDFLMLEAVINNDVQVLQGHKVTDLIIEDKVVIGVQGRDDQNQSFTFYAKVVVDAGGRNSISLRRLGLRQENNAPGKIALAAHWSGVKMQEPYCFMHISRPGYTGIAPVGPTEANVVLVVDQRLIVGHNANDYYRQAVLKNPMRRKLLSNATMTEKVRVVESLAYSVKPPSCGGLILVGDATGFMDPFTGEGIYLSLKSAELAAGVIDHAFEMEDFSFAGLSEYESLRQKEFYDKFLLSKILQGIIYKPILARWMVRTLRANSGLAQKLVGVIGDYVSADKVISPDYLIRFMLTGLRNCL
jgi:geranylgeranyl reductase family protein